MSRTCGRFALPAMLALSFLFVFVRAKDAAATPVQYVKVCSLYGAGFFYIPGTDTCIKLGGYLRRDYQWTPGSTGTYIEQPAPANALTSGLRTPAYNALQQSCYSAAGLFGRAAAIPWNSNCLLLNPGGSYQISAPGSLDYTSRGFIQFAGFHIGANGGGIWGSRDVSATEFFNGDAFFNAPFGTRNVQGWFGGGQVGYDWQRGHWVFGVEADVQGGSIDGMSRATFEPYVGPGTFIRFHTSECISAFGTARVRVGYAVNDVLLYGTAGVAAAETNIRTFERDSFGWDARGLGSNVQFGVAAGAGVEYKVSQHLSLKAEYLYLNLGDVAVRAREFNGAIPTATDISTSNRLDFNIFRVGANWRFDGGGTYPVMTPR